tara:strand:+ start:97 stop:312 length:216 start_codon:yes stop_codon:yes gene_type:complete
MKSPELKVGDLVQWTLDGDLGFVTKVDLTELDATDKPPADREPYFIQWVYEPGSSGWHGAHEDSLILLNPA